MARVSAREFLKKIGLFSNLQVVQTAWRMRIRCISLGNFKFNRLRWLTSHVTLATCGRTANLAGLEAYTNRVCMTRMVAQLVASRKENMCGLDEEVWRVVVRLVLECGIQARR